MAYPALGQKLPVRAQDLLDEENHISLPKVKDVPNPVGNGSILVDEMDAQVFPRIRMNHDVVIALAEILESHEVTLVHGVANIRRRLCIYYLF